MGVQKKLRTKTAVLDEKMEVTLQDYTSPFSSIPPPLASPTGWGAAKLAYFNPQKVYGIFCQKSLKIRFFHINEGN